MKSYPRKSTVCVRCTIERQRSHKQIDADKIENLRKEKASHGLETARVCVVLKWGSREDTPHTGAVSGPVWGNHEPPDVFGEHIPALILLQPGTAVGAVTLPSHHNSISSIAAMGLIVHQAAERSLINLLLVGLKDGKPPKASRSQRSETNSFFPCYSCLCEEDLYKKVPGVNSIEKMF